MRLPLHSVTTPAFGALVACASLCAACSQASTPASPSTPATSTTVTETFSGTLPVGGTTFYSFAIATSGTVNVTLVSINVGGQPSDVSLTVGIGTPSGTSCSATNQSAVQAGSAPQVTGSEQPGVYCVNVQDAGPNLPAPAGFTITIAHP